jgi:hypothetical protein
VDFVTSLEETIFASWGRHVFGEKASAFTDDGSGFSMFSNFVFKFSCLFFTGLV